MAKFKWLLIILGMVTGVFSPWQYQVVALVALLMGYAACFNMRWGQWQLLLAYLYGGLATGFGLHIFIANASDHQFILMVIQPLLAWLVLRIFFSVLETQFTLHPDAIVSQMRVEDEAQDKDVNTWQSPAGDGTSAWSGDGSGKASTPDSDGRYMYYDFYCTGEIAMGGPTYGDAVFSNKCAFTGVGPSIALSEDGRYAAMTLPSRNHWGVLLVDLVDKKAYAPKSGSDFWEIDIFKNGVVHGRFSLLTSNIKREATIQALIDSAEVMPLVQDDGWWVLNYSDRQLFPKYNPVIIQSKSGAHKVIFVPDLKPHAVNPFMRMQHPNYIVMVDDVLLGLEVNHPHAVWVDGVANSRVQDGRFLEIQHKVFDFREAVHDVFDAKNPMQLVIESLDEMTSISLGVFSDAGNGIMAAQGIVMPRSTSFSEAECESYSTTHPWDEDELEFWDAQGEKQTQSRSRIQTYMQYLIDLPKYSDVQSLRLCTEVQILNRANSDFWAKLIPVSGQHINAHYSAYTLTTSCGITLQEVMHEAIWSHCGRYLAIVLFESLPQVPHRIVMIDFEAAIIKTLPAVYALPSFIWFDGNMLEFSHVIGVNESIVYGMGKESTHIAKRIAESEYADNPYGLLIEGQAARLKVLEKMAEDKKTGKGYFGASVNRVLQHVILFAPDFSKPILQPHAEATRAR
jgi:hypothetical protein